MTFTRLNPVPFCSGHGTNFGDPVTLYNQPTHTFWAVFLATACGGQGIGAWKSTDGGVTWSVGPCIANLVGAMATASLAGATITQALPVSGKCTFPQ